MQLRKSIAPCRRANIFYESIVKAREGTAEKYIMIDKYSVTYAWNPVEDKFDDKVEDIVLSSADFRRPSSSSQSIFANVFDDPSTWKFESFTK